MSFEEFLTAMKADSAPFALFLETVDRLGSSLEFYKTVLFTY
jgi:hypothetical protein